MTTKNSVSKLNDDIHRFMGDADYTSAVVAIREGLKASHIVRKNREDGERGINYEDVADHTTRLHAAKLMLEYGFGKPATRAEISIHDETRKTTTPAEIMARLASSGTHLADIMDIYANSAREAEIIPTKELGNG